MSIFCDFMQKMIALSLQACYIYANHVRKDERCELSHKS
jgi:hypothetical protein